MNDKKNTDELEKIFVSGDAWLLRNGIVSPIQHNSIVLNLYMHFPKVKFVEYFMNPEERSLEVILHFNTFYILFARKERIIDSAIELLQEYLRDYDITVRLKRYKKGVDNKK